MILMPISFQGNEGEMRAEGEASEKMLGTSPFQSKENALFDTERALQKEHSRYFTVKGRGSDPQDPLVACLVPHTEFQ